MLRGIEDVQIHCLLRKYLDATSVGKMELVLRRQQQQKLPCSFFGQHLEGIYNAS